MAAQRWLARFVQESLGKMRRQQTELLRAVGAVLVVVIVLAQLMRPWGSSGCAKQPSGVPNGVGANVQWFSRDLQLAKAPKEMEDIPNGFVGGKFFIYNSTEFDFLETIVCYRRRNEGINIWSHEKKDVAQDMAELWMLNSLSQHPNRTLDPEEASLFYVPVLPVTSYMVGKCRNRTHKERMEQALNAISASPYFQRRHGADHLIICGWWRCREPLAPFREALHLNETSLLGISERLKDWSSWHCPEQIIVQPYVANTAITNSLSSTPFTQRRTTFFFAGCSRGLAVRKRLKILENVKGAFIHVHSNCADFKVDPQTYAAIISDSKFCMVPRGDTHTSRRFFDAIAAGCIPILQEDGVRAHLPFSWKINYDQFVVFAPRRVFVDEGLLLQYCLKLLNDEQNNFQLMHYLLLRARDELIWGSGDPFGRHSRPGNVGSNVLQEALWKVRPSDGNERSDKAACKSSWPKIW